MRSTKLTLLYLILLSLAVSPLQLQFHPFSEAELKGYYNHLLPPELKFFTWHRWFSSVFQDDVTSRLDENVGFRPSLIRLGNQIDYSLFGLTHAKGFLRGKDQYLYEEDYIHEYTGQFFIGTRAIDNKLARLKNVTDSLASYGISFILVFESGKAGIYPEYIPDRFHPEKRTGTNYDHFVAQSARLGLPFLDINKYFLALKDTSRYPLFPRYGMHWSMYGVHLVADTLSRFIAKASGKTMPVFKVKQMYRSDLSLGSDYDIAEMLNLACPLERTPGVLPLVSFNSIPSGTLSALVVADSYYATMVETYGKKMFGKQDYWYYNSNLYPHQNDIPSVKVDKSDLREKLKKYNVVMLMVSELNLHCCFWNFADEAFMAFHPEMKELQLDKIENSIRIDREWFRFMVRRSKEENLPLEQMIRDNAEYTFFTYYNDIQDKSYHDTIQYIALNIKKNAEWYKQIVKNAQDQRMPLDTALMLNAIYTYSQLKKK
jgi:hypothetical protein